MHQLKDLMKVLREYLAAQIFIDKVFVKPIIKNLMK